MKSVTITLDLHHQNLNKSLKRQMKIPPRPRSKAACVEKLIVGLRIEGGKKSNEIKVKRKKRSKGKNVQQKKVQLKMVRHKTSISGTRIMHTFVFPFAFSLSVGPFCRLTFVFVEHFYPLGLFPSSHRIDTIGSGREEAAVTCVL